MSKKKVMIGALLACICITFAVGHFHFNTSAEEATIVGCDMEENYSRGDEFSMPDGKVSYKGTEKKAESKYVVFPSGKANESDTIVLSEAGEYQVVFQAKFNGVTISAKESFVVKKSLLEVNGENSSAYIADEKINVSLATNDVFTYNKALDLSTATKDKLLLAMEFTPYQIGTPDAKYVNIRFTDIYDENNYVTIRLINHGGEWASSTTYITAGAASQPQIGIENVGDDPAQGKVYVNEDFGSAVRFSTSGLPLSEQDMQLKLYFDYEEKALYVDREIYSGGQNRLIVDFDDKALFGTELWEGFTTGEVKMSVFAENYQAATCNFSIATMNGNSRFNDTGDIEAPIVSVKSEYDMDELPTALVGKSYKLFKSDAVDVCDGKVEAIAAVYYKYYSEKPVKLTITDDAFVPTKEGTYVIEYSATDASGNAATECVKINAVKGSGMQVKLNDAATETNTGVPVKVISGIEYSDNSGNVTYSVKAKNKSTDEELKIDANTLELLPMSDGEWEVTVIAKDYVSTVKETFIVNANHTTQPQVYDSVVVPKYFIKDATYNMSVLSGYDFSSGKGVATDMDIFVTESGSEEKKIEKGQYIPEKTGSVEVTYRLTVDGHSCEKTYVATVVDVGYAGDVELSKYFVPTKGAATSESTTTSITYQVTDYTALDFVNLVQVKQLVFSFQVGEQNAYNKVNAYLTDPVTGKQVKMSYNRTENGATFSVNDGAALELESSFDGMDRNFVLGFDNDNYTATANETVSFTINQFLDGSEFKGFSDSLALFTIEVEGVSGQSQLIVKSLNSHTLNNTRIDRFAPVILINTNAGDRGIGEKMELTGAFVYDTLDPIATITLEVTDPSGNYVKDEKGVALDGKQDPSKNYIFELADYGDYTIKYIATDGKGKAEEYIYAVTAKDVTGPTLTIKKHKETAKAGATVKVAKTETKDDVTKECTVAVYVFNPEGINVKVKDGAFEASMSGTYTVRYMAFDESGNYAFASYEVDVK